MDDVRGNFLGPPHSITPLAVKANKNIIRVSSFEGNAYTQIQSVGHIVQSSSVILYKLAINARRLYCNFVNLSQDSLYQNFSILKWVQKTKFCQEYGSGHKSNFY